MTTIGPHKAGLVFGAVLGAFHLSWVIIVAIGWTQPLIDFVFWLHFIKPVFVIEPFSIGRAVGLVLFTGAIGYAMGALASFLCGRLGR